ncbi:MAG: hypothetical protein ACFFAV_02915 [Candidatus Hermodarchaeota archaeon]
MAISRVLILISTTKDFSISGRTYIIPGPIVLLYLPNRKIISRLYSVAVLKPVNSQIVRMTKKTAINIPKMKKISEICIPPFYFKNFLYFFL